MKDSTEYAKMLANSLKERGADEVAFILNITANYKGEWKDVLLKGLANLCGKSGDLITVIARSFGDENFYRHKDYGHGGDPRFSEEARQNRELHEALLRNLGSLVAPSKALLPYAKVLRSLQVYADKERVTFASEERYPAERHVRKILKDIFLSILNNPTWKDSWGCVLSCSFGETYSAPIKLSEDARVVLNSLSRSLDVFSKEDSSHLVYLLLKNDIVGLDTVEKLFSSLAIDDESTSWQANVMARAILRKRSDNDPVEMLVSII